MRLKGHVHQSPAEAENGRSFGYYTRICQILQFNEADYLPKRPSHRVLVALLCTQDQQDNSVAYWKAEAVPVVI